MMVIDPAKNWMGKWVDARNTPKVKLSILGDCVNFGMGEMENTSTPHIAVQAVLRTCGVIAIKSTWTSLH